MSVRNLLNSKAEKIWVSISKEEMYAHHLYLHIATQLQRAGYFGAQAYFDGESTTELEHFKKIREFMNNLGSVLPTPAAPELKAEISVGVSALEDALNLYYDTEVSLLQKYAEAHEDLEDSDCYSEPLLLEFIKIQTDSVGEAGDLLAKFAIAKECKELLFFDKNMK